MIRKPLVWSCIVALLGAALARCDGPGPPGPQALQLLVTELVDEGVRREVSVIGPRGAGLSVTGAVGGVDVLVGDVVTLRLVAPDFSARYAPSAPDGVSLRLVAKDDAGRQSSPLVLGVDRAPPAVTASTPVAGARVAELAELTFTLSDRSRVDFYNTKVRLVTGSRTLVEGTDFVRLARPPDVLVLTLDTPVDGTLHARVSASDVVGNVAAEPFALDVVVDRSAPTFTFLSPVAGAVLTGAFELAVDAAADTAAIGWSLDDVQGNRRTGLLAAEGARWGAGIDPRGLADGPLTLKVTAVDQVQHVATAALAGLSLVGRGPTLVALEPPRGAWVAENVAMRIEAGSLQDRVARLEARDASGVLIATISFNQDGLAAAGLAPPPATLTLVDAAQRTTVVATGWRLDTRAPVLTWSPPPTSVSGVPLGAPPVIVPVVLDAESGANTSVTLASLVVTPPPGGRAGTWLARAVPVDLVGNAGPEASATWQVDGQVPSVQIAVPAAQTFVGPHVAIVAALADDDRIADAAVAVRDQGGRGESLTGLHPDPIGLLRASLDLGRLAEGPVTLTVEAHDRAGLSGRAEVVVALDRTPPRITPRMPVLAWFGPTSTALFAASDAGAGLAVIRVRRADEVVARAQPFFGAGVALVTFNAGDAGDPGATPHGTQQTWFVSASDAVGNAAELAVVATIDRVPPVAFLTPVSVAVSAFPDLRVVLGDDGSGVDLDACELLVARNDVPVEDATLVATAEPGSYAIDIVDADLDPGRWSVRLVPHDRAGLVGEPALLAFTFERP